MVVVVVVDVLRIFFCSPVRARLRGQRKAHRQAGYLTRSPIEKLTWPSRAAALLLSSHGSCGSLTARGADQVYPEGTGNMWTGRAVTGAGDLQKGSVGIGHPLFSLWVSLCPGCQGRIPLRFPPAGLNKAGRAGRQSASRLPVTGLPLRIDGTTVRAASYPIYHRQNRTRQAGGSAAVALIIRPYTAGPRA